MAVQDVVVASSIDVDPAFQAEAVALTTIGGSEVIEERLDVLTHLIAQFGNDRFLQLEDVQRVVPASTICPPGGVAIVLHQAPSKRLQSIIEMRWSVLTQPDPCRE